MSKRQFWSLTQNSRGPKNQSRSFQLYLNYSVLGTLYGALASLILGFVWLSASVMSLLLGAALAAEWSQAWGEDGADAAA
jgi:membrane protein